MRNKRKLVACFTRYGTIEYLDRSELGKHGSIVTTHPIRSKQDYESFDRSTFARRAKRKLYA